MADLPDWKASLLNSCMSAKSLSFGTFTLKSGRVSPYFFNAGLFYQAHLLRSLSTAYAQAIASFEPQLDFDVLFGPAYKGIPLAAVTVDKLAQVDDARFGKVGYSFNRKVAKTYGDGGNLVGSPLKGKRVVIIDDVITAGTAIRESVEIIKREGGTLVGIIVALDRMEKMPTATDDDGVPGPSAIGEIRREYNIPVLSVLTLDDIIHQLKSIGNPEEIRRMEDYRNKYKTSD